MIYLCYKYEEEFFMSGANITKKAIAKGFKELMEHKTFDKITVSDITQHCGLNRQTFYYHFTDKYALLNWIYYNEIINEFITDLTLDNWGEHLLRAAQIVQKDIKFYRNAFLTASGDEFRRYFFEAIKNIFLNAIHYITASYKVDENDCSFVATFFAYGISETMINWICFDSKTPPEAVVKHIENLINDCEFMAVQRYLKTGENAKLPPNMSLNQTKS